MGESEEVKELRRLFALAEDSGFFCAGLLSWEGLVIAQLNASTGSAVSYGPSFFCLGCSSALALAWLGLLARLGSVAAALAPSRAKPHPRRQNSTGTEASLIICPKPVSPRVRWFAKSGLTSRSYRTWGWIAAAVPVIFILHIALQQCVKRQA